MLAIHMNQSESEVDASLRRRHSLFAWHTVGNIFSKEICSLHWITVFGMVCWDITVGMWSRSVPLFNERGWIPLYEEAKVVKWLLAFKRTQNVVPHYLMNSLNLNGERYTRATRYTNFNFVPSF